MNFEEPAKTSEQVIEETEVFRDRRGYGAFQVHENNVLTDRIIIKDFDGKKLSEITIPTEKTIAQAREVIDAEIDRLDKESK
jgi:hypothetical protein